MAASKLQLTAKVVALVTAARDNTESVDGFEAVAELAAQMGNLIGPGVTITLNEGTDTERTYAVVPGVFDAGGGEPDAGTVFIVDGRALEDVSGLLQPSVEPADQATAVRFVLEDFESVCALFTTKLEALRDPVREAAAVLAQGYVDAGIFFPAAEARRAADRKLLRYTQKLAERIADDLLGIPTASTTVDGWQVVLHAVPATDERTAGLWLLIGETGSPLRCVEDVPGHLEFTPATPDDRVAFVNRYPQIKEWAASLSLERSSPTIEAAAKTAEQLAKGTDLRQETGTGAIEQVLGAGIMGAMNLFGALAGAVTAPGQSEAPQTEEPGVVRSTLEPAPGSADASSGLQGTEGGPGIA